MTCISDNDSSSSDGERSDTSTVDFDVETCTEVYKEYIRNAKYGDVVAAITRENMTFIVNNKKIKIYFNLDFSFEFEEGFYHAYFTNFEPDTWIKPHLRRDMENYIRRTFVTTDRLSC